VTTADQRPQEGTQQYQQGYQAARAARHGTLQPPPPQDAAAAWRAGHHDGGCAEHAALVLTAAALRLLVACRHGQDQPGTCAACEPLEPLAYVALGSLALLCPGTAAEDPVALSDALRLAETVAGAHDDRALGKVAAALRMVTA
jgi:hypothetical protein